MLPRPRTLLGAACPRPSGQYGNLCVAPLLLDRSAKNGTDHKLNLSVEACVERPPHIERAGCAFTYASECSVGDGARIRSVRANMA